MSDLPSGHLRGRENDLSERLDSWKEIAAYLKRDVRTVQRWEREEGLPVQRLLHAKQGTVYAQPQELDAWWNSRRMRLERDLPKPTQIARTRRIRIALTALVVTVLVVGAWWVGRMSSPQRSSVGARSKPAVIRFGMPLPVPHASTGEASPYPVMDRGLWFRRTTKRGCESSGFAISTRSLGASCPERTAEIFHSGRRTVAPWDSLRKAG